MLGFKALLAWHYLILFTPLLIGPITADTFDFFYDRQLTLYLSLALSFGLISLIGKRMLRNNKTTPSPVLLGFVCVLATLSTALAVFALQSPSAFLRLGTTALVGFSKALMLFLWVYYYAVMVEKNPNRSLAIDMVAGALIAFVIFLLQHPFPLVVIVLLPIVAGLSLVFNWQAVKPQGEMTEPPRNKATRRALNRHFLKTILPTMVFAFVFGLLQGGYIVSEKALLMATSPYLLLGIVAGGTIILLLREGRRGGTDLDKIHRISMLLFVLGVLGLTLSNFVGGSLLFEAVILAGFNLFDFGGLILAICTARRLHLVGLSFVEGTRSIAYLALGGGLICGRFIMELAAGDPLVLYLLSGITIALIVATSLTPFHDSQEYDRQLLDVIGDAGEVKLQGAIAVLAQTPVSAVTEGAMATAAVPHAVGAPAPEAARQATVAPAPETARRAAKTPIVEAARRTGKTPIAESAPLAVEASIAESAPQVVEAPVTEAMPPSVEAPNVEAAPTASEAPRKGRDGSPDQARAAANRQAADAGKPKEAQNWAAPWKRVCTEIARLYHLSPRETEIFLMIAKGRNAEYVQQKLVISTHTAKTHIANIYHKLGIHSAQELLDLVEEYKYQDFEEGEKQDSKKKPIASNEA